MGLWDWVTGRDLEERANERPQWFGPAPSSAAELSRIAWEGNGSPNQALEIATIYRCIEILSTTIAQFPAIPYKETTGEELDRPAVFRRPDPRSTYRRFFIDSVVDMLTCGEATWHIAARGVDGNAIALRRVDASLCDWRWNPNVPYPQAIINADKVLHISGQMVPNQADYIQVPMILMPGQASGVGPIEAAGDTILATLVTDRFVRSTFTEGVMPSGVVEIEASMSPDAAARVKDEFIRRSAGSRAPVIMTGGAKYQAVQATAQQAQFTETRGYQTNELARMMGVPAAMLNIAVMGGSGTVTYQNSVSVRAALLQLGLSPIMMRLEDALTQACLPSTQVAHLDSSEYLNPLPEAPGPQPDDPQGDGDDMEPGDPGPAEQANEEAPLDNTPQRGNTRVN